MSTSASGGFTVHQRVGWGPILAALLLVIAAETAGVHVLVRHWSAVVAWTLTILDLYGIVWLVRDYRALRLRPTTIDADALHIRYGLRWSADVPLSAIESVEPIRGEWKRDGVLKIAMFEEPKLLIRLREPVNATAFGVLTRKIDAIAILPDDSVRFEAALSEALGSLL
ncbi:MAG TPA: hypothetical protein VL284_03430 [Thermoanaerobaculia bacterium]|nr:hypothetical protein [Thermoanaerobaculia bacterium]